MARSLQLFAIALGVAAATDHQLRGASSSGVDLSVAACGYPCNQPGYRHCFIDPRCAEGNDPFELAGCNAGGRSMSCRLCGLSGFPDCPDAALPGAIEQSGAEPLQDVASEAAAAARAAKGDRALSQAAANTTCTNSNSDDFVCGEGSTCCGDACVQIGGTCCQASEGASFPCGEGSSCCGDVCTAPGGTCCQNFEGASFPCGEGSSCCGDVCMAPGGTCCQSSEGGSFPCGEGSSCCGDTCAAPGGICCKNELGSHFPCAFGSQCCGNTCAAGGDKCCTNSHGTKYAVSGQSPCIDEMKNCTNRRGVTFVCGKGSECCGDACMAPGAVCCENNLGMHSFSCGQFSKCCGNVCMAPGSRCCTNKHGFKYPAVESFTDPWEHDDCTRA